MQSLDGLLPQRTHENLNYITDANRRLTLSHAKNIQDYLHEHENWLLGALLLGISPKAVEFEPYKDENGQPNINFGELRILANQRNTMRIFDGQHRRHAIGDLLRELDAAENGATGHRADLLRASMSVALYEEENIRSLRQMFTDAAQNKPIEASTVTRFDRRNAFNRAAMYVVEESRLFARAHRNGPHDRDCRKFIAPCRKPVGSRFESP